MPPDPTDPGRHALDQTLVSTPCLGPWANGHAERCADCVGAEMVGGDGVVSRDDVSEKRLANSEEDVELAVEVLTQDGPSARRYVELGFGVTWGPASCLLCKLSISSSNSSPS